MRKILFLLLCLGFVFALTACNSTRNKSDSKIASHSESTKNTTPIASKESEESKPSNIPSSGNEAIETTNQPSTLPTEGISAEMGDGYKEEEGMIPINITIGNIIFTGKLYDNETTQALVTKFPMTIEMDELNGQEKYYYLAENLPAESTQRPTTIHKGEIMCWSGNCLVFFYKTYPNSYGGYVPLGTVDDPSNLAFALGSGNVEVTWSLDD